MTRRRHTPPLLAALLLFGLTLSSGRALLNIDGTRNQVFVFGGVTFGYNSNIFSDQTSRGDYTVNASAGVELKRRAGIIGVNATMTIGSQIFTKYTGENSLNPNFAVEFTKSTGRTTGSLTVNAFRETRSDSVVNQRTTSWNFPLGLSLKYPINEKLYATSSTTYLQRTYNDTTVLTNLTDYSQGLDLFYVYTSKLDLVSGYRIRASRTTNGRNSTDHWFNVGASGGLLAKLNGTVRFGYQLRHATGAGTEDYAHFNALASVGWPVTRKLSLAGQVSRDFNTIATGASIDSTSMALNASYAFNRKLTFDTSLAVGRNTFLGSSQPEREDTFFSWDVGARYRFSGHLTLGATYAYFKNWSSSNFSDFDRNTFTFDIGSRY